MASVFRPTYTAIDPATGRRVKRRSKTWHIRYYLPDGRRLRISQGVQEETLRAVLAAMESGDK